MPKKDENRGQRNLFVIYLVLGIAPLFGGGIAQLYYLGQASKWEKLATGPIKMNGSGIGNGHLYSTSGVTSVAQRMRKDYEYYAQQSKDKSLVALVTWILGLVVAIYSFFTLYRL